MHSRFKRKVLAFRSEFNSYLAKQLVDLSPYVVPDNLSVCIEKFDEKINQKYKFSDSDWGMVEIDLSSLTHDINDILESIPEVMELNERKNGKEGHGFTSLHFKDPEPDDDFICIMAVAQNITVDFAREADAQVLLDSEHYADQCVPLYGDDTEEYN